MTSKSITFANPPATCDVCNGPFNKTMYDASVGGPWGCICNACFKSHHCTLGTGRGQKYERQDDGTFLKTAG